MRIRFLAWPLLASLCAASCGDSVTPFQRAVAAIGGEDALAGLERFQIDADGKRFIDYESPEPGEAEEVSAYKASYKIDLTADSVRADMERTPLFEALSSFPAANYSIVLNGRIGGLTAQAGFVAPGSLPSQHVAALRRQQLLFNPHLFLRGGLSDPGLVGDGGEVDFDGRPHDIVVIADTVSEVRLFVDRQNGFISKLETLENNILVRDFLQEVRYRDWSERGALAFPDTVELYADGLLVQQETRTSAATNPTFPPDTFDLPPEAGEPVLDAEAYSFGETTHQVFESFFHLAFVYGGDVSTKTTALAPGVTLVGEGDANSLAVELEQGLILFEAPQTPKHGTKLVATLAEAFPGKSVTHVVQSHYHQDHASGVRSLVAADAAVVIASQVRAFWDRVLSAESTVRPDALSAVDVEPRFVEVPKDGSHVFEEDGISVTVHQLSANPHADDMLITVIDTGGERLVFEADLYNAGYGLTLVLGGPESLFAGLRELGIVDARCQSSVPLTIVPVHGAPHSLSDSLAELDGQGIDVGCR